MKKSVLSVESTKRKLELVGVIIAIITGTIYLLDYFGHKEKEIAGAWWLPLRSKKVQCFHR